MKIKPHPARKSRITTLLLSIFVFMTSVAAMDVNTRNAQSIDPTPSIDPIPTDSPSATPKVASATPYPKVTVSKLKTKKKKVHVTTGASKKK